ncbi:hypothetical protein ACFQ2O_14760 [Pontibacter rugosus]|uniref:Uncharacterized protein n=1 Tax=Pontibacter rugosus TaxID=1745966 RepID=A0ABW3SRV9_9BACT
MSRKTPAENCTLNVFKLLSHDEEYPFSGASSHGRTLQALGGKKHDKVTKAESNAQEADTPALERVAPKKRAAHMGGVGP